MKDVRKIGAVQLGRRQTLANGLFARGARIALLNSGDSGSLVLRTGSLSRQSDTRFHLDR